MRCFWSNGIVAHPNEKSPVATFLIAKASLALSVLIASSALYAQDIDLNSVDLQSTENPLTDFRIRLAAGEASAVTEETQSLVDNIKIRLGRFNSTLIEPLRLLGDAQFASESYEAAVGSYEETMSLMRMNSGPFSKAQIDLYHQIAKSHAAMGEFSQANKAHEQAYETAMREFGTNDARALPALMKLLDWYESNHRYHAARVLHLKLYWLTNQYLNPSDTNLIQIKRAFAIGMKQVSFPPMDRTEPYKPFAVNIPGYERSRIRALVRPYVAGRQALRDVLNVVDQQDSFELNQLATALLEIGDWEQIYNREQYATPHYRRLWYLLEQDKATQAAIFSQPKLLYIHLPDVNVGDSKRQALGMVDLTLTISNRGTVIGRRTLDLNPVDRGMEFRVRTAAKYARFRPAFVDGEPVRTKGVPFKYFYQLRPTT